MDWEYIRPNGDSFVSLRIYPTSPPTHYDKVRDPNWLKRGEDPTVTPVLKRVRWERDGHTFIWPGVQGFNGPPSVRTLGRDFGCSYRLVFAPKKAMWEEPFVIIDNKVRVRFLKRGVEGYEVTGFEDETPTSEGTVAVEGEVTEVVKEGDFIELLVTVTGDDDAKGKELAKTQVESIAGLLAICLGEQLLGDVVFEDYFFSSESEEQGEVIIPVSVVAKTSSDN